MNTLKSELTGNVVKALKIYKSLVISFIIISSIFLPFDMTIGYSSEGLILNLTFDEGSGNIVYDLSGEGNTGIINGASWTEGYRGTALDFDRGDWVNCGINPIFDVEAFTIEAWIFIYGPTGARHQIVSKYFTETLTVEAAYIFELWSNSQRPILTITPSGDPPWTECHAFKNISFTEWTFVTSTYDGTLMQLYINGTLVGIRRASIGVHKTSAPVIIGNHFMDNRDFNGRIDEVRMYNRVLTNNEIRDDYRSLNRQLGIPLNIIFGIPLLFLIATSFIIIKRK